MDCAHSISIFKRKLKERLDCQLDLVINENRSTMLHILEKKRAFARLSIHRMFLTAPDEVISAIAYFVKGKQPPPSEKKCLRGYIQTQLAEIDYSSLLNSERLSTRGRIYDLKQLFDKINETYFEGRLNLSITWYGKMAVRRKSLARRHRIVFGEYVSQMRLIKIHRLLDDPFFPEYFVSYIIFHEIAHHRVPGFIDKSGCFRIHGVAFKMEERKFGDYDKAIAWEKANRELFFAR